MVVRGYLVWSHLTLPKAQELVLCKGVVPAEWQRDHWADRLNVSLSGCYDEIVAELTPMLPEFLARTDLAPVERFILESHLPEKLEAARKRSGELDAERESAKKSTGVRN